MDTDIYICTSHCGVTLEWDKFKSVAEASFRKAGKGAKLEILKSGIRRTIKRK